MSYYSFKPETVMEQEEVARTKRIFINLFLVSICSCAMLAVVMSYYYSFKIALNQSDNISFFTSWEVSTVFKWLFQTIHFALRIRTIFFAKSWKFKNLFILTNPLFFIDMTLLIIFYTTKGTKADDLANVVLITLIIDVFELLIIGYAVLLLMKNICGICNHHGEGLMTSIN